MITKAKYRRILKDQNGAVAATYALALFGLLGITGLAFDYARVVSMDTELQNAADQAALAGATQLDRTAGSMERAIAAIQGGLVSNSTLISNDGSGSTIAVTNAAQVVFYPTRADAEARTNGFTNTTNFKNAGFVQVTVDTRGVNYALTPIVGAFSGSLAATAVAGMGSAVCRIPPLMICNPDEGTSQTCPDGTTSTLCMNVQDRIGKGLLAKPGGGGQWQPGNYGYLDVGLANGAPGVRQALGWGAVGNCISQTSVGTVGVDTQTGNIANAPETLNTRFDIYDNCEAGNDCPSAYNVTKDFVRELSSVPSSTDRKTCEVNDKEGWRLPPQNRSYLPPDGTSDFLGDVLAMGHPRDRCHATYDGAPGNCKNDKFGNGNWDRNAYFRTHYKKLDGSGWTNGDWTTALSGANLYGSPSIAQISRYAVYKWEEANAGKEPLGAGNGKVLDRVSPLATGSDLVSYGTPICSATKGYTNAYVTTPDRRKMTVAVLNCTQQKVKGNVTGKVVAQWIDVFLVQAAANRQYNGRHYTGKDEIYVEIVGSVNIENTGSTDGITIRRDVPYLVQ